jgi:DNA-binding beta-propeller fold protein YncE
VRTGSTGANGLALLKGERTLAVGVGNEGVAFLDVHDLIHGKGSALFAHQTDGAGTFDVVATPDGSFVFSSNEYGIVDGQRGSVGVIATHIDRRGRVANPQTLGQIAVGDVVPSLSISPEGSRLYVASELIRPQDAQSIAGAGNPLLSRTDCVQHQGTPARPNGYISVIDTHRAIALEDNAILARVASGCSPVRIVETSDARTLFVSARGDNAILSFDARMLESDPEHAFLRAIPSGGTTPVGMRLFANDRFLAVANSNRFADANGNLAILDLNGEPKQTQARLLSAGGFPRNLGLSADGSNLYLTNYTSRSLQVIRVFGR